MNEAELRFTCLAIVSVQSQSRTTCLFVLSGLHRKVIPANTTDIGVLTISNLRELTRLLNTASFPGGQRVAGEFLAKAGIPGENQPNSGLSAIAVWLWLALRALRPLILVYNFEKRHTPGEAKSCAPQALSPVPLWRPSKALGLQCRDKCLTPEIA